MMPRGDWDPLKELAAVRERMNNLFESALARTNFDADGDIGAWTPAADVYETEEELVLALELPGLDPTGIDLRVEEGSLLVQGDRSMQGGGAGEQFHRVERSYGKFARRFPLPPQADRGSVSAVYRDGVLRVKVGKRGDGARGPVRVEIR
jgi:HSP20 family protein